MVRKERLEKKWRRTRGKRKGGIVEEKDGRKEERMDGGMEGVKEFREKEGLRRGEKITCFYCPGFGSFGFRKVGRDVGTFSVCDETRCFLNVP